MADLLLTYFERDVESGSLEEAGREEFDANTSPEAARQALEAGEEWASADRRNRSYRIERLLPPD
jgi:hypothetical protein